MSEHPPTTLSHREQSWHALYGARSGRHPMQTSEQVQAAQIGHDFGYDAALALAADLAEALALMVAPFEELHISTRPREATLKQARNALARYRAAAA